MATFGQGINANLGAIDYSAYQRGATQGAQSIGQGLAGLGQGIGQYKEQKKKNALRDGFVASSVKSMTALSNTLRKAGDTSGADEALASARAIETETDLDKRYAMAQNGLQNYATIQQLGQQALGERKKRETAAYYNALIAGPRPVDIMDGAVPMPNASQESIAAANEMLVDRRYKLAQTDRLVAEAAGETGKAALAADEKEAIDIVGSALTNEETSLNLTGLTPRVAAIAQAEWTKTFGNKVNMEASVLAYDKRKKAGADRIDSFINQKITTIKGRDFLQSVDAEGEPTFIALPESEKTQREEKRERLETQIKDYAIALGTNDQESMSKLVIQMYAENANLAASPKEFERNLKPYAEAYKTNRLGNQKPAVNAPTTGVNRTPLNATAITPNEPVAPAAQAVKPAGVLSPEFGAAAALSAANDNPPAYRNGVPVSESTNPVGGSGVGVEQSALGASSVTPSAAVKQAVVAASAPGQTANLQKGAAEFVSSATSTASTIANNANELYLAAEVGNAILKDPVLKADVKNKLGNLLSKVFNPKVRAMARLSPKAAKVLLSGTTKVAGQLVRPAMMVNSLDIIIGKYVGKSFPEQETTRATQAAASVLALWSESSTDNKNDEAMALLAQKSRYLMSSNMNREKKLAKNAEYLRLMNVLMERQSQQVGSFQKYRNDQLAQFNNQFGG